MALDSVKSNVKSHVVKSRPLFNPTAYVSNRVVFLFIDCRNRENRVKGKRKTRVVLNYTRIVIIVESRLEDGEEIHRGIILGNPCHIEIRFLDVTGIRVGIAPMKIARTNHQSETDLRNDNR
jgi:hypothetical protein